MFFRVLQIGVFCLAVTLTAAFCATAAESAPIKIGVMNIQKVLVESEPGIQAKQRFEEKKKELEAGLENEQKELQDLKEEIEKKSSVWTKEKKDEKILEFNKLRRDFQTRSEDARLEMKRLQEKELEPIIKELEKVVDSFGEREKFSVILDSKSSVVYFDKAYDVSDELIKELNKTMK